MSKYTSVCLLLMLSAQVTMCWHTPPRIELPRPGSHLCSQVILRLSGVLEATNLFPGLHVVVSLNGRLVPMDRGALLDEMLLSLQPGKHTASLELVNRTTRHEHFMVFQHLVAFSTSGAEDCLGHHQQDTKRHAAGVPNGAVDESSRRRRNDAQEQQMWRGTLRLLESLSVFPPAPSDWKPRSDAKFATPHADWFSHPSGNRSRWNCRPYSGFCWKDYQVQSRLMLPQCQLPIADTDI